MSDHSPHPSAQAAMLEISAAALKDVPVEGLQASLCYLMTRFAWHPCPGLARAIVRILTLLLQNPAVERVPVQKNAYRQAIGIWSGVAEKLVEQFQRMQPRTASGRMH